MSTNEILTQIEKLNYACLYVMSSGQRVKFGPGELLWHRGLRTATTEQRQALAAKLAQWNRRSA